MDLRTLSRWFDDTPMYDGYGNTLLYSGQMSSFIDSQVDGSISKRRILSLDPDLARPARGVLTIAGDRWLVGDRIPDTLQGQVLRASYALKRATDLGYLRTAAQAALGTGGTQVYAHKDYLKSVTSGVSDAQYDPFWEINVSQTESVTRGMYYVTPTAIYRARAVHDILEGFRVLEADQVDAVIVPVVFQGAAYDYVTEAVTGSTVSTTGLLLDAYMAFDYKTQADPRFAAGDHLLFTAMSVNTPKVGADVMINGVRWKIFSVVPDEDAWKSLVRLA